MYLSDRVPAIGEHLPADLGPKKKIAQTILAINYSFSCLPSLQVYTTPNRTTFPLGTSAKMSTKHEKDKPYAVFPSLSKYEFSSC